MDKIWFAVLANLLLCGFGTSSLKRGDGGELAALVPDFAALIALAYIPFLRLAF